jgi:hypothetical protein
VKRSWEIIADKLSKAGWTWGCVATMDALGRTIFVADAHRDDAGASYTSQLFLNGLTSMTVTARIAFSSKYLYMFI